MKQKLLIGYLIFGGLVCSWFFVAARSGWRAPNFGFVDGSSGGSYGRTYGGYWGGGK